MKVFVTGATGFLGHWLVRRLLDEGLQVRALARSRRKVNEEFPGLPIEIIEGDLDSNKALLSGCEGCSGVFHLAGLIAYKRSDRPAMEKANVIGTQNILEAAIQANVPRFLHLSSVVAVGASFDGRPLNENSEYNVGHLNLGYFETKHKAEQIVRSAAQARQIEAVMVNPATIYGPGDAKKGSRGAQLKVARGQLPFYPPGGVNVVHVDDVVQLIMDVYKRAPNGERYIAASENLTLQDLFKMIAKIAQVEPPKLGLPRSAIFALGAIGDVLEKFGLKGPVNSETAWTSTLYHWFEHEKATKAFGFKPRPAIEAIEASIRWSRNNGLLTKPD